MIDTDVSGQPSFSRNVGIYKPTLRNMQEERRFHLHRGGKSEFTQ